MRKIIPILLLLFMACSRRTSNTLLVGMELSYPPFEMSDSLGNPCGISVDLAKALGASLGKKIKIENMAFDQLIPSLKTGKIDLIISSLTATSERARAISFSEPYLQTGLCLLINKDADINGIGDCNKPEVTIVVKKGTTGHIYAKENLQKANILVLNEEAACVSEVSRHRAEAFIYDQVSVFSNWQKNQETTKALLEPFQREYWAVGVRQEDEELRQQINDFLTKFREENGFEALGDKYLATQKAIFTKLGYSFYF